MTITKSLSKAALSIAFLLPSTALLADDHDHPSSLTEESAWKLFDYGADSNPSIAGILFPDLHAFGSFGDSTADPADLAVGHHDPQRDVPLQGLEPGMSLRAGVLQGFVTGSGTTDAAGDFDFEMEEAFLKLIELPFGLELRGGQFLNRFGFQSAVHNHSWDFVNQNLVNGRLLSEGELITRGGELSWLIPMPTMTASILSVSVGDARVEDHDHDHDHDHGHGEQAEFEAEGALFGDLLTSINWVNQYDIDDRNRLSGTVSSAFGENLFGRDTAVYGVGFEYLWRDRGYSAGGPSLRWRTEFVYRTVDAISGHLPGEEEEDEHHDEHGEEDHHDEHEEEHHDEDGRFASFDDIGTYSSLVYGFNEHVEVGLRGDWVSGIDSFGLDDRWRISPAITFYANAKRNLQARLQYDYDYSDDFGSENSVWLQIGFNWGGAEVR